MTSRFHSEWLAISKMFRSSGSFALLFQLLQNHLTLQTRQMVDEENAFEMVHLML